MHAWRARTCKYLPAHARLARPRGHVTARDIKRCRCAGRYCRCRSTTRKPIGCFPDRERKTAYRRGRNAAKVSDARRETATRSDRRPGLLVLRSRETSRVSPSSRRSWTPTSALRPSREHCGVLTPSGRSRRVLSAPATTGRECSYVRSARVNAGKTSGCKLYSDLNFADLNFPGSWTRRWARRTSGTTSGTVREKRNGSVLKCAKRSRGFHASSARAWNRARAASANENCEGGDCNSLGTINSRVKSNPSCELSGHLAVLVRYSRQARAEIIDRLLCQSSCIQYAYNRDISVLNVAISAGWQPLAWYLVFRLTGGERTR